ncbi:MAG: hypothetical protein M0P69_08740 [Bacteroidales bacterium]|nr:hypothetical protein [Bacteroidales bacterium]
MAIVAADIKKYLTGASSDGGTQSDPDASLGGFRSSTVITDDSDNNIFDDVSGAEASAGDTEYRCICLKNEHDTLELQNAKVYMADSDIGSGNTLSFAVEVPAAGSETNGSAQTAVANEATAPTVNSGNVSDWSTVTTFAGGVALNINAHDANLGVDEIVYVWIKRVIGPGAAAASGVNFTIRIEGDTAA